MAAPQRRLHVVLVAAAPIVAAVLGVGCTSHQAEPSPHTGQAMRSPATSTVVPRNGPTSISSPSPAVSPPRPHPARTVSRSQHRKAAPAAVGCPYFPSDNIWHADVSRLPVRSNSAAITASIGGDAAVHADFGAGEWDGGPIGIPVTSVAGGQPKVNVSFEYADESDSGSYPIPREARIEGGPSSDGDRHVILLDHRGCRAYELYRAFPRPDGSWQAGSGAIFDLRHNALRPRGWTSADAAGLSILAGLVRYDEVAAGRIDHAIRVTAPRTASAYVWPARHAASDLNDAALPPMGQRLRLRADVDISGLPRQARIIATAMKRYGLIVADNGSPMYISGTPDNRWDNDSLHALDRLTGKDFEAVDVSRLMISSDSAASR